MVTGFEVDSQRFIIHFLIFANNEGIVNNNGFIQTSSKFDLVYHGGSIGETNKLITYKFYIDNIDTMNLNDLGYEKIELAKIFNVLGRGNIDLEFPFEILKNIETFQKNLKGFPSSLSGTFLRMLYLSMVTITTLGYGDIVPLTNFARMFIGIESITGIVMIGWFATVLLNKFEKSKRE